MHAMLKETLCPSKKPHMQKALTVLKYLTFLGLGLGIILVIGAVLLRLGPSLYKESIFFGAVGFYTFMTGVFFFMIHSSLVLLHKYKNHPLGIATLIISVILLFLFVWEVISLYIGQPVDPWIQFPAMITLRIASYYIPPAAYISQSVSAPFSALFISTFLLSVISRLVAVSSSPPITKRFKTGAIGGLGLSICISIIAIFSGDFGIPKFYDSSPGTELINALLLLSLFCGLGGALFTWLSIHISAPKTLMVIASIPLALFVIWFGYMGIKEVAAEQQKACPPGQVRYFDQCGCDMVCGTKAEKSVQCDRICPNKKSKKYETLFSVPVFKQKKCLN